MVLVGLPLLVAYVLNIPWFNLESEGGVGELGGVGKREFKSGLVMSLVMLVELVRLTVHYLVIYIFG